MSGSASAGAGDSRGMQGLCKRSSFGSGLWQRAMGSLAPTLACWMSRVRQQHHQAVQDLLHQPFQTQQQHGHLPRRGKVGHEVGFVHRQLLQCVLQSVQQCLYGRSTMPSVAGVGSYRAGASVSPEACLMCSAETQQQTQQCGACAFCLMYVQSSSSSSSSPPL